MAPIVWGTCPERSIGLFQKNANRRGFENMEFQWVLKKEHVEIRGVNLKAS